MRKDIYIYAALLLVLSGTRPVQAQTDPSPITFSVTILDADGEPATPLLVQLVLFEYGESLELVFTDGCVTDESGSCAIEIANPPHTAGWIEGRVAIDSVGEMYLGWARRETEKHITIQLLPGYVMATLEPLLHPSYEGQPESGTDAPLDVEPHPPTVTPNPTVSSAASPTPSPTATSSPSATQFETPVTVTPTPEVGGERQPEKPKFAPLWLAGIAVVLLLLILAVYLIAKKDQAK